MSFRKLYIFSSLLSIESNILSSRFLTVRPKLSSGHISAELLIKLLFARINEFKFYNKYSIHIPTSIKESPKRTIHK